MRNIFYASLFFLFISTSSKAGVIQAGSCERDSVYKAVNSASDGDTIFIPYGTAVWKEPVVIRNKSIFILGISENGNKPAIVDSIPSAITWEHTVFWFDLRTTDTVRVSNLNFYGKISKPYGFIMMRTTKAFRVDHCIFDGDSLGQQRAIVAHNAACGVFDNNVINIRAKRTTQGLAAFGDGEASWNRASSYGTIDNFYIEDCEFNFGYLNDGAMDAYNGARVVFRNNRVNGTALGWHGFDSGNYRSTFLFEVYNNTFINSNPSVYTFMRSRGGSALIHNNVITGNYNRFFILSNYRSCPGHEGWHTGEDGTFKLTDSLARFVSGSPAANYIFKTATNEWDTVKAKTETSLESDIIWNNGDHYSALNFPMACGMCMGFSPCDSNYPGQEGYPCLDQIGRGTDQELSPVYAWNNNFKGNLSPSFTVGYSCEREALHIQQDRDYFENTEKPGYTPFTYPHPYRLSGTLADPDNLNTGQDIIVKSNPKPNLLKQNYPNPFSHETTIQYCLADNIHVMLKVYDITGREIASLVNEHKPAGTHTMYWNGNNSAGQQVGSGVYFYQLTARSAIGQNIDIAVSTKKMIIF